MLACVYLFVCLHVSERVCVWICVCVSLNLCVENWKHHFDITFGILSWNCEGNARFQESNPLYLPIQNFTELKWNLCSLNYLSLHLMAEHDIYWIDLMGISKKKIKTVFGRISWRDKIVLKNEHCGASGYYRLKLGNKNKIKIQF